ncbi:MAG TPA: hypothetical protein VIV66_14170 [Pyrinomonadaceae bacterium]
MKNRILKTFATASVMLMLASATIKAQSGSKLEINIPFDFTAGTARLKAGIYKVKRMSDRTLAIQKTDETRTALLNTPLNLGARDSEPGRHMVFNKYGDQYFLAQVWLDVDNGRQLFTTKAEEKAAREFRLAKGAPAVDRVAINFRN